MNKLLKSENLDAKKFVKYDEYGKQKPSPKKHIVLNKTYSRISSFPKNDMNSSEVSLDAINNYLKLVNDSLNMIMLTAVLSSQSYNNRND